MQTDGLTALRIIFAALVGSGLLILGILIAITPDIGRIEIPLAVVVIALGVFGSAAGHWATRRPLKADSPDTLALSYKSNFFVAYALNESPLLISFVLTFVTSELWPYLVELPLWLVGLGLMAPTNGNLAKRQQEITAQGSTLSLVDALRAQRAKA